MGCGRVWMGLWKQNLFIHGSCAINHKLYQRSHGSLIDCFVATHTVTVYKWTLCPLGVVEWLVLIRDA